VQSFGVKASLWMTPSVSRAPALVNLSLVGVPGAYFSLESPRDGRGLFRRTDSFVLKTNDHLTAPHNQYQLGLVMGCVHRTSAHHSGSIDAAHLARREVQLNTPPASREYLEFELELVGMCPGTSTATENNDGNVSPREGPP